MKSSWLLQLSSFDFYAVLVAGTIYIIFMYKKQEAANWLTVAAAGTFHHKYYSLFQRIEKIHKRQHGFDFCICLAIPVFLLLAINGIWKDEKLVKSLDRLR
jgi:hypothetical protein